MLNWASAELRAFARQRRPMPVFDPENGGRLQVLRTKGSAYLDAAIIIIVSICLSQEGKGREGKGFSPVRQTGN
jgi:hypothetical protein